MKKKIVILPGDGIGKEVTTEGKGVLIKIAEILTALNGAKPLNLAYVSDAEIVDRCILTMVNEAAKCLEEGVVKNARHLDMAMIMGTGVPAFRGGVLRYADSLGIAEVVKRLEALQDKCGERFEVSELLLEMANKNQKFYA